MQCEPIYLEAAESQALLTSGDADAAFLYLYLRNGNDIRSAKELPGFTQQRLEAAIAHLQALNLYQPRQLSAPPKFTFNEQDLLSAMQQDMSFQQLTGEVQHRLGKTLTTEELKILLNIKNYLGLPSDVICVLVSFITSHAKKEGRLHSPSLYRIEKEAYRWSDMGIDTMNAAFQYIHQKEEQRSKLSKLMQILQIRGRALTDPERKFAESWLQMDVPEDLIKLAYDKTCLKTGGLNWAYMDAILTGWKEAGFRTPDDVRRSGRTTPGGNFGGGRRELDADEIAAIEKMLQYG